jgi:hypothetical protein
MLLPVLVLAAFIASTHTLTHGMVPYGKKGGGLEETTYTYCTKAVIAQQNYLPRRTTGGAAQH